MINMQQGKSVFQKMVDIKDLGQNRFISSIQYFWLVCCIPTRVYNYIEERRGAEVREQTIIIPLVCFGFILF